MHPSFSFSNFYYKMIFFGHFCGTNATSGTFLLIDISHIVNRHEPHRSDSSSHRDDSRYIRQSMLS